MAAPKRLFIIDAMAMAFRSHYAFGQRPLTTASGQPTSAVFGSAMQLTRLILAEKPDYLVVATDSQQPTFRHAMFPAYKANRSAMPEDLAAQLPHFFELCTAIAGKVIREPGLEADDLIGTLARRFASDDVHVYIVSGDKDFMQLIDDRTFLYTNKKGEESTVVKLAGVHERFGVTPAQVIDCLAITGDTSDNIPGVHGIGDKGASKLIAAYGSLDGIYANLDKVSNPKQRQALIDHKEDAYLSQALATIKTDAEIPVTLADMAFDATKGLANAALLKLYRELEFNTLANRVEELLAGPSTSTPKTASAPMVGAYDQSDVTYSLVNNKVALAALVETLAAADQFAFDTETTGLSIVDDTPIGISLSVKTGAAYYVPLIEKHLADLDAQTVLTTLKPFFASPTRRKIGHNLKFDLQMLTNVGLEVAGPFVDTMICDHLLDAGGRQHGLDACCLKHLNYRKIPTSELIGPKGQYSMLDCDLELLTRYACEDADYTLRLAEMLLPRIEAAGLTPLLTDVEMPLVSILAKMERAGVHIDTGALADFSARLKVMAADLEKTIFAAAGQSFNINSPKQLGEVLFEKMKIHTLLGIKSLKKTKTGFSTDESVLTRLAAHPLPKSILEYRSVAKLKSTYVDALPMLVNDSSRRVHTSYHQTGTATGRLSSSEPNLQNIPIRTPLGQEIRKAFCAPDSDTVLISADYSQIELRLLAHLADATSLVAAFAAGEDIHRSTAAKIFGIAPEAVDTEMRSRAKAINFGVIYGMGPRRLAAETGVTLAEAEAFISRYFETYPEINRYVTTAVDAARKVGYSTTITGRRRPIPELQGQARHPGIVANAENMAVNSPIQGSAADLIKLAMIRIDQGLRDQGLKAKMLMQVHDELVFECPRSEIEAATAIISDAMRGAMPLKVPLDVQIGVGVDWLEAH